MEQVNILIIDDEQPCVETLQSMLARRFPNLPAARGCNSVAEALQVFKDNHLRPDLVFLDVEMPYQNGFDLLLRVDPISFDVIFTTAHEQHAIKAIKFNALDYLLKPFSLSELDAAMRKFLEKRKTQETNPSMDAFLYNLHVIHQTGKKIALPTMDGLVFVPVHEIIRCESLDNYTKIYFINKSSLLVCKTLKDFEYLLEDMDFFRVHHSHLINMQHVKSYIHGNGGYVLMQDGTQVEISRRRKSDFLKKATRS